MATTPKTEEPGFETDVNELDHDKDNGLEGTLEENSRLEDERARKMEDVQEEAAEERKEGGYQ